jgi:hypothetical protein
LSKKLYRIGDRILNEDDIQKAYFKQMAKYVPTRRDIIKAALNTESAGEGSRLSKVAFAIQNVQTNPDEAMKNKIVREGLKQLGSSIDKVSGEALTKGLTEYQLQEVIKKEEDEVDYDDLRDDIFICPQCGQDFGNKHGVINHLEEVRAYQNGTTVTKQSRYRSSGDRSSNDARFQATEMLSEAERKYQEYLRSERAAEAKNNPKGERLRLAQHEDRGSGSSITQGFKPVPVSDRPERLATKMISKKRIVKRAYE